MTDRIVAQRIVMPTEDTGGALPLYVRGDVDVVGRRELRLAGGCHASLATYFNAFPWRVWATNTTAHAPALRLDIQGSASLGVHCVTTAGVHHRLRLLERATGLTLIDLPDLPSDASWLWAELSADEHGAVVRGGEWLIRGSSVTPVSPAVAITTMNRVDDCIRLLGSLQEDGLPELLSTVFVVDQGSNRVSASADVSGLAPGLDVRVIEQANLGGSGGFSRGMIEALDTEGATHVLLLDDDVLLEPEAVFRMCAFASVGIGSPIVGAQMLSLVEPTVLHSMGEVIDRTTMWWHATEPELSSADLATLPLEKTDAFFDPQPVDFNGWWMCLIPLPVVRRIGASMPYFIKWDDAEYGLRAAAAGYRTITVPGIALWHVPWTAKDDGLDWQAYYHLRNRLVTGLIHAPGSRGMLVSTWKQDINHILCQQYGAVEVRCAALRDILRGPSHLPETLATRRADMQQVLATAGLVPTLAHESHRKPDQADLLLPQRPRGHVRTLLRLIRVLFHQLRRPRGETQHLPSVPRDGGKWWSLGLLDGAVLATASGNGAFLLRRNRREALVLLGESLWLRLRMGIAWHSLSRDYTRRQQELSSVESWGALYDSDV